MKFGPDDRASPYCAKAGAACFATTHWSVVREKGKFRSFLLASLNYYLSDERDRAGAQKRGGGRELLSLDGEEAEARYRLEPVEKRTPESIFERRWAMALLDQVLAGLAQ